MSSVAKHYEINDDLAGELEQQASQYTGSIDIALLRDDSYKY